MIHPVLILALAFAVVLGGLGPSAAQTARALPDFDGLWDEAKRWAVETGTVPEDCVFDFRLDPKTNAPRDGRAVTEWKYGPCALGSEQYWMFEQYPPGRKTWSTVRTRSTANASAIDGGPRRARRLRPWAGTVRGRQRSHSA